MVLLVVTTAWSNFSYNNRTDDRLAYNYAQTILNSFDRNAVVWFTGDLDMPAIKQHVIDGVREDITIYNTQGLVLSNRLSLIHISEPTRPY